MEYTVITGASSGIGFAAAKAFAARGENLIVIARRSELLQRLKDEIAAENPDVEVIAVPADLSRSGEVYRVYYGLGKRRIKTWVNNAGFGNYSPVCGQDLRKTEQMLSVDISALTIFSTLYARDHINENATLINVSSAGGYTIVPNAVTYCAAKFYVSAFTEGLARELISEKRSLRVKLLAPAATETEFGKTASGTDKYDYGAHFKRWNTADEMARFLLELYDSEYIVGRVDRNTFEFELSDPLLPYAGQPTDKVPPRHST